VVTPSRPLESIRETSAAEHIRRNMNFWDSLTSARGEFGDQRAHGRRRWTSSEPEWGDWSVPESALGVLPATVSGLRTIELGCGTAYVSAWLARRGARPVGLDFSRRQLGLARGLQQEFGLDFPLVRADAESVPFLDGSFDLVISEYGAPLECDPGRWIPEAARLLAPGGQLIFLSSTPIGYLCTSEDGGAAGDRLVSDYFDMGRRAVPATDTVEFQLPYGDWIRLLRRSGLHIQDLIEIRPPAGSRSPWPYFSPGWARRWPSEHVWKASRAC
jgi:SAM-dependent methyltransferase